MQDLPQLSDSVPYLYQACIKNVKAGHNMGCKAILDPERDITDCTCGYREALKAIAYARGDDPIKVDEHDYEL